MEDQLALLKKERRFDEAMALVEKQLERRPGDRQFRLEKADLVARLGRAEEALRLLSEHPESELGTYHLALKAGLLQHTGWEAEAAELFERLADAPRLSPAVARRVVRYFEERDPDRAVHLSRRLGGDEPEAILLQADALARTDAPAACELLREGLSRYPGHPRLVVRLAELQLGGLPPQEVASELEILLSLQENRGNVALRERRVQALRASGQLEEARTELLECLRLDPGQHYLRANLAYVERDLGHTGAALDLMEELLIENSQDRYVLNAYCKTCRDNGLVNRATAFIGAQSSKRPELKRWWGTLKKVLKAALSET